METDEKFNDVYLTKTDLEKIVGITAPTETLTIVDNRTGIKIIIEPYIKGKGVEVKVNRKINIRQLLKAAGVRKKMFKIPAKYRRKYR
jgi:hypothetical protein